MKKYALVIAVFCFAGCSPIMEATRPDPVDVQQFAIGENRMSVVSQIGSPVSTLQDHGNSCDIYKLYTRGPDDAGKAAIAAGEVVADVFTLCLAEIIFTPTEIATKNSKHTVTFCYSKDDKLVSFNESDGNTGGD